MKLENEATELARESGIALIVEKAHLSDGKIGIEGVEVEASLQDTTKNVDENNNRKANFGLPGLIYFKTSNFLFNQKNSSSPTRKIKSELQDVMQNEFVPLECSEEVLPLNIFDLLREAIEANRTSLCCYYLVVNTLTYYFSRKTWSNSVQGNVIDFISQLVQINIELLPQCSNEDSEKLKLQIKILLEVFVFKYSDQSDTSSIVNKLLTVRKVYGDDELHTFFVAILYPEFNASIHRYLIDISHTLGINLKQITRKLFHQIPSTPTRRKNFNEDSFVTPNAIPSEKRPHSAVNSISSDTPSMTIDPDDEQQKTPTKSCMSTDFPNGTSPDHRLVRIVRNSPKKVKIERSSEKINNEKDAVSTVDDVFIAKYRLRMNSIKSHRNRDNEIFYGRNNLRQNLFDEQSELEDSKNLVSSNNILPQKNRARRSIKEQNDRIHIAHILLNVHNDDLLSSFKISLRSNSSSVSKIRKLVKPAIKSKRKKIIKLRKAQRNRKTSQTNNKV